MWQRAKVIEACPVYVDGDRCGNMTVGKILWVKAGPPELSEFRKPNGLAEGIGYMTNILEGGVRMIMGKDSVELCADFSESPDDVLLEDFLKD